MKTNLDLGKSIEETENKDCVHIFKVTIDEKQTQGLCQAAAQKLQHVAKLPGFRKGKTPLSMIRTQFAAEVQEEAVEMAAKASLPEIYKQNESLNPVATPILKDVKYEEDKSIILEIQIETPPVFEVKDYTGLKAERKAVNVSDDDVDKAINQELEYNAYLKPVDENTTVAANHYLIVDYHCVENGEKVPGSEIKGDIIDMNNPEQGIKGMAEALLGAKKSETREFTSKLGDKDIQYVVTVSEIKEKVVPTMDEDFFKSCGVKDEAELKARVRKNMEANLEENEERSVTEQLENALIKNNPFALPPTLVAEETHDLIQVYKKRIRNKDIDEKKAAERLNPIAIRNLSLTYILHAIAKKENIKATDEDLANELNKAIESMKSDEEKARARELFEERKEYIRSSMTENKTMEFIKSKAEITTKK